MLKVMERRLLRLIINPAMIATFVFGGVLLATPTAVDWHMGWIYVKLALIVVMTGVHGTFARWRKDFAADQNRHDAKFYRAMNELPTVLMIAIVILAIDKPF